MRIGPRAFAWGARTYIMGVINVSPESFSGDGLVDAGAAVAQARRFADEGADILDVGGQSTRPGPRRTDAGFDEIAPVEELRRVLPAIEGIRRALPEMPISIDTYKPGVARAALEAGAHLINDITGFRQSPALARIAAEARVPVVAMHNQRGRHVAEGDERLVAAVLDGLRASLRICIEAGIAREQVIIDPGFGFGWTPEQNLALLRCLPALAVLEAPVLIGTSRKSSVGDALGGADVRDRVFGTAATVAVAIANGADIVRVHDVAAMAQVARVTDAIVRAHAPSGAERGGDEAAR
ncbi:MAG: dihydropteroate synthase [Dehalococcoidia bacterium]|nr:dihydropteroate synthase [Dehalococcoidia bacterium]